jgi:hypothetical protein
MAHNGKFSYHQRIVNLLRDGEWHTLREIHRAVARFIDADLADKEYRKRHPAWEGEELKARVAQGKKRLVLLSLLTLVHNRKLVEIGEGRDWDRQYRLTRDALAVHSASEA